MNWYFLKKIASYKDFHDKIENLARNNPLPFSHWFDESGRSYVPIAREGGIDKDVEDLLVGNGYTITDYGKGYCEQNGRQFKIGKILEKLRQEELNSIQQKFDNGEIYNLERENAATNKYFDEVSQTFMHSTYRSNKGAANFYAVISQNPHDVASMSTGRNWTSCMNLEGGAHHEDIFCEVQEGGLVAYLIRAEDPDIRHPIARIRIRRFVNNDGESIAMTEDTVYGNDIDGFSEVVNQWIKEKQPKIKPGNYKLTGGEYSDTFSDEEMFGPTDPEDVTKWLRGEGEDAVITTWEITDNMFEEIEGDKYGETLAEQMGIENRGQTFSTKEEAEKVFKIIQHDESSDYERESYGDGWEEMDEDGNWERERFTLDENVTDNRRTMRREAIKIILSAEKGTYPIETILEIKNIIFDKSLFGGIDNQRNLFASKYPELLSKENLAQLDTNSQFKLIKNLPEDKKKEYQDLWKEHIEDSIDHPENSITSEIGRITGMESGQSLDYYFSDATPKPYNVLSSIYTKMDDNIFGPAREIYSPIPENLILKMVDMVKNMEGKAFAKSPYGVEDMYENVAQILSHTFAMTKSDTPTVQNYYKSLLKYWKNSHHLVKNGYGKLNIRSLGYSLAKLGENGRDFLSFLKNKMQEQESLLQTLETHRNKDVFKKQLDSEIEAYLYTIDAIENGTGFSKKYKFFSKKKNKNNWYKLAKSYWTRGQVYTDSDENSYDVGTLEELSVDLDIINFPVDALLAQLSNNVWGRGSNYFSPESVIREPNKDDEFKDHFKDIQEADLKKPILIRKSTGEVIDGYHRLSKAHIEGLETIAAKMIDEDLLSKAETQDSMENS